MSEQTISPMDKGTISWPEATGGDMTEIYGKPCTMCAREFLGYKRRGWCTECYAKAHPFEEEDIHLDPDEAIRAELDRTIGTWGPREQIKMIMEEAMELAIACRKLDRNWGGSVLTTPPEKIHAVLDELADMKIMLAQAEVIFKRSEISKRVRYKMQRLKGRLDKRQFEDDFPLTPEEAFPPPEVAKLKRNAVILNEALDSRTSHMKPPEMPSELERKKQALTLELYNPEVKVVFDGWGIIACEPAWGSLSEETKQELKRQILFMLGEKDILHEPSEVK